METVAGDETGTVVIGLILLCPQEMRWEGTVSQKEAREGEIKRPGVLNLGGCRGNEGKGEMMKRKK